MDQMPSQYGQFSAHFHHAERLQLHLPHLHRLRLYRSAPGNRRLGRNHPKSVFPEPVPDSAVPVLWPAARSNQSAVVGGRRICTALQAVRGRQLPVAEKRGRGSQPDTAAVPLAYGGAEYRPAQSTSSSDRHPNHLSVLRRKSSDSSGLFLTFVVE